MRQDIKIILKGLTDKDPSDSIAEEKTIKLIDGLENSYMLIDDFRVEIQRIKDFRGDREPFYNLYLSIAYLKQKDFKPAKEVLENAVQGFQIQGFSMNEALGEWLFGIIHFENGNFERAQRAVEAATTILQQLITRSEEESKYERAKEYRECLRHLDFFRKTIKESRDSEKQKISGGIQTHSSTLEISIPLQDTRNIKAKLRVFYEELDKTYEYLREQKKRIPPTLVAAKFYIYRTLTPAHSVYRSVPPPETDDEKRNYEELMKKVGFFEVIEQLVELERDFEPEANREEILEKINQAWDEDTSP